MYGTIMRAKLKAGRKEEYKRLMQEMEPGGDSATQGLHSLEVAWEDKDPDRIVVIVHFRDRDSYIKNADRPETNEQYQKQVEFFEGPPEWIDVNYERYVGRPLAEESAART